MISYPIFNSSGWILFDFVGYVFMSYCRIEHFGDYLQKRTPTIKSTRTLKSQISGFVLMNCVPLIAGVHLYL